MKYILIFLSLILFACSSNQNTSIATPIDLNNQAAVKTYLNGDWFLIEDNQDRALIRIYTDTSNSLGTWQVLNQQDIQELNQTGSMPLKSSPAFAKLVFKTDSVFIKLTGIGGSDLININFLSENTLILDQTTYVKK